MFLYWTACGWEYKDTEVEGKPKTYFNRAPKLQVCVLHRDGADKGNFQHHCLSQGSRTRRPGCYQRAADAWGKGALGLPPSRRVNWRRSTRSAALDEPRPASPRRGGGAMRLRTESSHHMCPVPVRGSVESRVREAAVRGEPSRKETKVGWGTVGLCETE